MVRKYGYLVVEGPHDAEFACRLLSPYGLKRIKEYADVGDFFDPLIPKIFPHEGDMLSRVPVPLFVQNDLHQIAIYVAGGDTRIVEAIYAYQDMRDMKNLVGMGIIMDSDHKDAPMSRFRTLCSSLDSLGFSLPDAPGKIEPGKPNFGVYILPDNCQRGTLEDLLLKSAEQVYPKLLSCAQQFVESVKEEPVSSPKELEEFNKPAGHNKAIAGAMATVLRPGKAIQASIQDNKWLKGEALNLPEFAQIQTFFEELFELKPTS